MIKLSNNGTRSILLVTYSSYFNKIDRTSRKRTRKDHSRHVDPFNLARYINQVDFLNEEEPLSPLHPSPPLPRHLRINLAHRDIILYISFSGFLMASNNSLGKGDE